MDQCKAMSKKKLYVHGALCVALLLLAVVLAAISNKAILLLFALPPIPGYLMEIWHYLHTDEEK